MSKNTVNTKIIALAQIKGGCGKTTLSAHIAGILALTNSVVIIDADNPQFSISNWFNQGYEKENITLSQVGNSEQLLNAVDYFDGEADYIIIDLAPRLEDLTRAGLAVSNITIVPVNMDLVEIWALNLTVDLMKEAEKKIAGFQYYVMPNKFKPYNANHMAMKDAITEQFECKLLDSYLGLRTTFSKAIGDGCIVQNTKPKDNKAIAEMTALVDEIKDKLGTRNDH